MRRTFHWTNIKSRCCCSAPAVRLSDVTRITVIFNQHCLLESLTQLHARMCAAVSGLVQLHARQWYGNYLDSRGWLVVVTAGWAGFYLRSGERV